MEKLFSARCGDLQIPVKEWQRQKFEDKVSEMSFNRKLNLTNMMIGPLSAQLLSDWILDQRIDITHLILAKNNLGDEGVIKLAEAISFSKSIVFVDFTQNGLTPRCAKAI